jgi:hypothetical protein
MGKILFSKQSDKLLESKGPNHLCGSLAWLWNTKVLCEMMMSDDLVRNDKLGTDIHVPCWLIKHDFAGVAFLPDIAGDKAIPPANFVKQNTQIRHFPVIN